MVARNPLNNKSAIVNRLVTSNEEEQAILATSERHQQQRMAMSDESLLKRFPNEKERALIHNMFLDTLDLSASTFKVRVKPEGRCLGLKLPSIHLLL